MKPDGTLDGESAENSVNPLQQSAESLHSPPLQHHLVHHISSEDGLMDGAEEGESDGDGDELVGKDEGDERGTKRKKESHGEERKGGRRKINIEFIENKSRRHVTFSKRKAGLIKKAYELSTLTGTQVLLLVASETGNVYTFATPKLQPLITKPEGKTLIQSCLNPPEEATNGAPSSGSSGVQARTTTHFAEKKNSSSHQNHSNHQPPKESAPLHGMWSGMAMQSERERSKEPQHSSSKSVSSDATSSYASSLYGNSMPQQVLSGNPASAYAGSQGQYYGMPPISSTTNSGYMHNRHYPYPYSQFGSSNQQTQQQGGPAGPPYPNTAASAYFWGPQGGPPGSGPYSSGNGGNME